MILVPGNLMKTLCYYLRMSTRSEMKIIFVPLIYNPTTLKLWNKWVEDPGSVRLLWYSTCNLNTIKPLKCFKVKHWKYWTLYSGIPQIFLLFLLKQLHMFFNTLSVFTFVSQNFNHSFRFLFSSISIWRNCCCLIILNESCHKVEHFSYQDKEVKYNPAIITM